MLYDTIKNISKTIDYKNRHVAYVAMAGPLSKQFELIGQMSNLTYTKKSFFPHLSMESLHFYFTSIKNIIIDNNYAYPINLKEYSDIFCIELYKIMITTE